ncbi:MAG: CHRD domain-containing protein [Chloroflexi bacterium]|nr:CHRD domain-containing protein [Chloroflexota bacterium]
MKRLALFAALAAALLATVACEAGTKGPLTLTMQEQNNSGQTGTATLTPRDGQTEIAIDITASLAGVAQPAHIHAGSCANLGAVRFPLSNVTDGTSTTTVDADLATLQQGAYAVNVHQSAQEIAVFTSCADITTPATGAVPPRGDSARQAAHVLQRAPVVP